MLKINKKKAQVGSEMLFAAGIVLLIFILLIPININKRNEVRETSTFLDKKEDCKTFVNILARVVATENLKTVATIKHNLSLDANSKIVDVDGVVCSSFISMPQAIELQKGKIEIKNSKGTISIKNV